MPTLLDHLTPAQRAAAAPVFAKALLAIGDILAGRSAVPDAVKTVRRIVAHAMALFRPPPAGAPPPTPGEIDARLAQLLDELADHDRTADARAAARFDTSDAGPDDEAEADTDVGIEPTKP